ncbi:MAG: S26 family signal peptidase [Candidatus Eremiobacteraeota bacterium]|nr:S26 family signal peptidase [Candidatus Eremiobacteraeota bacterium]
MPILIFAMGLRLNFTESMPRGVYRIKPLSHSLTDGDVVAICLPSATARVGRLRGYLGSGGCPGDAEPVLKIVIATAGETVVLNSHGIAANSHLLPNSNYVRADSAGRSLETTGCSWPSLATERTPMFLWLPNLVPP